jgi:hypothetical protein
MQISKLLIAPKSPTPRENIRTSKLLQVGTIINSLTVTSYSMTSSPTVLLLHLLLLLGRKQQQVLHYSILSTPEHFETDYSKEIKHILTEANVPRKNYEADDDTRGLISVQSRTEFHYRAGRLVLDL